jgi:hypothetical protein
MTRAISQIVGQAESSCGIAVAYRALQALMCVTCGQTITEGEIFTRHSISEEGLRIMPKCRQCFPFRLLPVPEKSSSSLLESLLSPETPDSPLSNTRQSSFGDEPDDETRQKAMEAMLRRLGPALARSRRKHN